MLWPWPWPGLGNIVAALALTLYPLALLTSLLIVSVCVRGVRSAVFDDRHRLVDFELDEDRVITDVRAVGTQLFQRHETRIAEPNTATAAAARIQRVPGARVPPGRWSLELSACAGTRHKTLDNVLAPLRVLVAQNHCDRQSERPVEQRVVVTGDDPDVDRQVRVFSGPCTAGKQRRSQSIAVRRRVERRTSHLQSLAENTRLKFFFDYKLITHIVSGVVGFKKSRLGLCEGRKLKFSCRQTAAANF